MNVHILLKVKPFSTNVPLMQKPGRRVFLAKCGKNNCGRATFYVKMQVDDLKCHSSTGVFQTF